MSSTATATAANGGQATAPVEPGKSQKIVSQVEYYFGDINLPRDKFLQEEMKRDNGWIPLSTMLKFNRLAALTTDIDDIAAALRDSHLIDLSEDSQRIRRNPDVPLPENTLEYWQEIKRRTVYMKGFPAETTLDELAEFLGQFGTVENIVMRKTRGSKETPKVFKGSVFATYVSQEEAKAMAAQKELKFKGEHELVNMMQDEYWANKYMERQKQKELKKKMKKTQIEQQNKAHYKKGMVIKLVGMEQEGMKLDAMEGQEQEGTAADGIKAEEEDVKRKPITSVNDQIHELKTFFEPFSKPAFVLIEGNEATIRFMGQEEGAAKDALDKAVELSAADGKLVINGARLEASMLDGSEEAKYWEEFSKSKADKVQRMQQGRKQPQRDGAAGKNKRERKQKVDSRKRRADQGKGHQQDGPKGKRTTFKDNDDGEDDGEQDEELPEAGNGVKREEEPEEPVGAKKAKVEEADED